MSDLNDNENDTENGVNIVTSSCYLGASEDFSAILTDEKGKDHLFRITSPGDSKNLKEMLLKKLEQLKKKEEDLKKVMIELDLNFSEISETRREYFDDKKREERIKELETEKNEKSEQAKGNKKIQDRLFEIKKEIDDLSIFEKKSSYDKKAEKLNDEIGRLKDIKINLNLKGSNRISEYEYGLQAARWERIAELTEGKTDTSSVRYNSNFEQYALYMKDIFNICNEISKEAFTKEQYEEYIECVRKRSEFFKTIEGELAKKLGIKDFDTIHVLAMEGFEEMLLNPNIGVEDFLEKVINDPNSKYNYIFEKLAKNVKESSHNIDNISLMAKDIKATNVLNINEKTQEDEVKKNFTKEEIGNTNFSYVEGKKTKARQTWNDGINEKIENSTNEKYKKNLNRELDTYSQSKTKGAPDVYLDKQGKKEIDEKVGNKNIKEFFEQDYERIANDFKIYFSKDEAERQK